MCSPSRRACERSLSGGLRCTADVPMRAARAPRRLRGRGAGTRKRLSAAAAATSLRAASRPGADSDAAGCGRRCRAGAGPVPALRLRSGSLERHGRADDGERAAERDERVVEGRLERAEERRLAVRLWGKVPRRLTERASSVRSMPVRRPVGRFREGAWAARAEGAGGLAVAPCSLPTWRAPSAPGGCRR